MGSGSGSVLAAAAPRAPAAPAAPGSVRLASLPPLGPPDTIEPPSREIVPGMTIDEALAKGARKDTFDYQLAWKPDLDLGIDKKSGLVTELVVTYRKADFAAVSAKWGKPSFGDEWLGANWEARLNGCSGTNGDCTVSFTRSPFVFLGATPQPPLGLATLGPRSPLAEIAKLVGVGLEDRSGVPTGFGLTLGGDPADTLVGAIVVGGRGDNGGPEQYAMRLDQVWGKRVPAGDKEVWFSKDRRWVVESGLYGDTLRYTPLLPAAEMMTQLRALPVKLWRKPKAALAAAVPDLKNDAVAFPRTEWAYGANDGDGAEVTLSYDDKETVEELRISIFATPTAMKAAVAAFEASWGKPVKAKTENGEAELRLTVDGIPYVVTYEETMIALVARAPEPTTPTP